jgi:hypothetical protein
VTFTWHEMLCFVVEFITEAPRLPSKEAEVQVFKNSILCENYLKS